MVVSGLWVSYFTHSSDRVKGFQKKKKKRTRDIVKFCLKGDFVCVYVYLSVCAFEC